MSEVQQTRWDRIIRRVSGSVGTRSHVSETLSELFPTLDVENVPGELLLLGGTRLAHGGGTIVGANSPKCQVFNPLDSGHLLTVTGVVISTTTEDTLRWGIGFIELIPNIGSETFRDTRLRTPQRPVGAINQETAVALASGINQCRISANDPFQLSDPNGVAVLGPGTGLEFGLALPGNTLFYAFTWREREALSSELQF